MNMAQPSALRLTSINVVFILYGVPSELKSMFLNSILPSLTKDDIHLQKTFLCFGEPEAALHERLNAVDLSSYTIGYRATRAGNLLKLYGPPLSNDLLTDLRHRHDCCLAEDEKGMAAAIGAQLKQNRETIATAGGLAAGRVSSWLASIPGASAYLLEASWSIPWGQAKVHRCAHRRPFEAWGCQPSNRH